MSTLPKLPTVAEVMAGVKKAQLNIFKPVTKVYMQDAVPLQNFKVLASPIYEIKFRRACVTTIYLYWEQSLILSFPLLWEHLAHSGGCTQGS